MRSVYHHWPFCRFIVFSLSSYRVMPLTLKFLLRSVWYWLVEDPFSPRFLLHKGCRLLVLDKYVGEYIGVISGFQVIGWFYQSSIFYINRAFISSALSSVYICFAKHRWASVHMRLYRVCIFIAFVSERLCCICSSSSVSCPRAMGMHVIVWRRDSLVNQAVSAIFGSVCR